MLATVPCVTIAFFSKPPPPPPPPAFDVLSILLALAAILGTVLVFLLMRKSTPASNGSTAKSKKGRGARTSKEYPRGPLLILWGSQTGTAEGFGNELMREARRGYNAKSVDLEEYTGDQLSEEKAPCVFLMATNGEGEPTDNAMEFYSWANDEDPSAEALSALRFAVFGLGNTQYEHFCFMGKWCHRRLQELGATALCAAGEGNDDEDIRADFEAWCAKLWPALAGGADDGAADTTMSEPSFEAVFGSPASKTLTPAGWLSRAFPKFTLYECAVSADRELCSDPTLDSGSVKHIELACAGKAKDGTAVTLAYAGADDLGVCCDGGQALAVKTAARLGLKPDAAFTLKPTAAADGMAPPLPTPCTVEIALRYYADLRLPSSKQMLSLLAAHCANKSEAQRLAFLASADGKAEYASYVQRDGRGLAEPRRVPLVQSAPRRPARSRAKAGASVLHDLVLSARCQRDGAPHRQGTPRADEGRRGPKAHQGGRVFHAARRPLHRTDGDRLRPPVGLPATRQPGHASGHGGPRHGRRAVPRLCAAAGAAKGPSHRRRATLLRLPQVGRRLPVSRGA